MRETREVLWGISLLMAQVEPLPAGPALMSSPLCPSPSLTLRAPFGPLRSPYSAVGEGRKLVTARHSNTWPLLTQPISAEHAARARGLAADGSRCAVAIAKHSA